VCHAKLRVYTSIISTACLIALNDVPDVIPEYIAAETNVWVQKQKHGVLIANYDNVEEVNGFESVSLTPEGVGERDVMNAPELANIKLIRARFESPCQQPTEQSQTSRKVACSVANLAFLIYWFVCSHHCNFSIRECEAHQKLKYVYGNSVLTY
jgi:hypothetical protein